MLNGLKSSLSPMQMSNPKCKHSIYNSKMKCNLHDTLFLWNHFLRKFQFLWFFLCLRWCKIWNKKREHNVKHVLNPPPNLNLYSPLCNKNMRRNSRPKQTTHKDKKKCYGIYNGCGGVTSAVWWSRRIRNRPYSLEYKHGLMLRREGFTRLVQSSSWSSVWMLFSAYSLALSTRRSLPEAQMMKLGVDQSCQPFLQQNLWNHFFLLWGWETGALACSGRLWFEQPYSSATSSWFLSSSWNLSLFCCENSQALQAHRASCELELSHLLLDQHLLHSELARILWSLAPVVRYVAPIRLVAQTQQDNTLDSHSQLEYNLVHLL